MGFGKWKTICDDTNSWYMLADNTELSKHASIKSLHKKICSIIEKLPSLNRKKSNYKFLKNAPIIHSKNTRSKTKNKDLILKLNKNTLFNTYS